MPADPQDTLLERVLEMERSRQTMLNDKRDASQILRTALRDTPSIQPQEELTEVFSIYYTSLDILSTNATLILRAELRNIKPQSDLSKKARDDAMTGATTALEKQFKAYRMFLTNIREDRPGCTAEEKRRGGSLVDDLKKAVKGDLYAEGLLKGLLKDTVFDDKA